MIVGEVQIRRRGHERLHNLVLRARSLTFLPPPGTETIMAITLFRWNLQRLRVCMNEIQRMANPCHARPVPGSLSRRTRTTTVTTLNFYTRVSAVCTPMRLAGTIYRRSGKGHTSKDQLLPRNAYTGPNARRSILIIRARGLTENLA